MILLLRVFLDFLALFFSIYFIHDSVFDSVSKLSGEVLLDMVDSDRFCAISAYFSQSLVHGRERRKV